MDERLWKADLGNGKFQNPILLLHLTANIVKVLELRIERGCVGSLRQEIF